MKTKDDELYNDEIKKRFLSEYDETTADKQWYLFAKTKDTEEILSKDVKDFNSKEFESLLYSLEANSKSSIDSQVSTLKKYIRFCKKNNLISQGISMIEFDENFSGQNLLKYIKVMAIEKKYPNREELFDVAENCDNPQDGVILGLIFEGVSTWHNLIELTELRTRDVVKDEFGCRINISSRKDGYNRQFEITEQLYSLVQEAANQTLYQFRIKNESTAKVVAMDLTESDYVVRSIVRRSSASSDKPDPQLIRSRVIRLKEDFNNQFLTPTNILYAGMIEYAKEQKKIIGPELSIKDYKQINRRFGIPEQYCYKTKEKIKDYV